MRSWALAFLLGGLWWVFPPPASSQEARPSVPASDLVRAATGASGVDLTGVSVEGDLRFPPAAVLHAPFRCQDCAFTGSIIGPDLVFERILDLSGSSVAGTVDLSGAIFKDRAILDKTSFSGKVNAAAARSFDDVSFTGARFGGEASFDRAHLGGPSYFADADFGSRAGFAGAVFGGRVEMSGAVFEGDAAFRRADFRDGAVFRAVRFRAGAELDRSSVSGQLVFDNVSLGADLSLAGLGGQGAVTMVEAFHSAGAHLFVDHLSVKDLSMDAHSFSAIEGSVARKEILRLIELSAQSRGNLAAANDAHFRLLRLEGSQKASWWSRRLDDLYRATTGYLVRPSHPFLTFLALIAAGGLVRAAGAARGHGKGKHAGWKILGVITLALAGIARAADCAFRRRPKVRIENPDQVRSYVLASARLSEFFAYKFELLVFLVALGNSNATVRQLIQAVRR